jgi:hypothetical protein
LCVFYYSTPKSFFARGIALARLRHAYRSHV